MITVGIVGCGPWGLNHLRNFAASAHTRVACCCDTDPARLQLVRQRYPQLATTDRVATLFNDRAITAVVVATPTAAHYAVVKAALEHDKDVLCEKPLAPSAAQCAELTQLAAARQRILMVGHVFIFHPAIRTLREYVTTGTLGRLYYVSARRTNLGPIRTDVDAVWDLASHDLSIFDYLLDGALPLRVSACAGAFLNAARADVAFISLAYPGHVVANVQVSWLDPQKRREVTVVGAEKMAIFNDLAAEAPLWLYDKGARPMEPPAYATYDEFRALPWERDSVVPHLPREEPLVNEMTHFLACVRDRRPPQTDGHNGWRIACVLDAIHRSMAADGQPVAVTPAATTATA